MTIQKFISILAVFAIFTGISVLLGQFLMKRKTHRRFLLALIYTAYVILPASVLLPASNVVKALFGFVTFTILLILIVRRDIFPSLLKSRIILIYYSMVMILVFASTLMSMRIEDIMWLGIPASFLSGGGIRKAIMHSG